MAAPRSAPGATASPPTPRSTSCASVPGVRSCTSSATIPSAAPGPEATDELAQRRVEGVVDRLAIDAALAELPEEFRVPVVMRDVGDLDYAEIAEALSIPIGTVKSRIARGRRMLLDRLGNRDPSDERPTREESNGTDGSPPAAEPPPPSDP